MFDALKGMGDLSKVIGAAMRGDKSGIIAMLKPELPGILTTAALAIIQAAGGDPATDGAYLWRQVKANGKETIMATVYRRNELDEPGDIIGTIDVLASVERMDLSQFIQ